MYSLDEEAIWQLPLSWQGDKWWSIRFRAMPGESNQATRLSFKLWPRDQQEPTDWVVSEEFGFVYEGGKCALWGFPIPVRQYFSTTYAYFLRSIDFYQDYGVFS